MGPRTDRGTGAFFLPNRRSTMSKIFKLMTLFPALILFACVHVIFGIPQEKPLSLEWISLTPYKTVGATPYVRSWSEDGSRIYFWWNPEKKDQSDLYWISPEGGQPAKVAEIDRWKIPEGQRSRNKQETHTVYSKYGDIFLLTIKTGRVKRLFQTSRPELRPYFLDDGERFFFEADGQIHCYYLKSGTITQLTDIRTGKNPEEKDKKPEAQEYLQEQQKKLFDILKKRETDRIRSRQRREKENPGPAPYYLGSDSKKVISFHPSPNGKHVAFLVEDTTGLSKGRIPQMPKYVTDSGFVEFQKLDFGSFIRYKVGAPVSKYRLGVYEVDTGKVNMAEPGITGRETNHNNPVWTDDSSKFAFVVGSVDSKDRWIAVYDVKTAGTELVDHERDDAWIRDIRAGRGGSEMGWLKDNRTLFFLSERDKWWHLYSLDVQTKNVKQLTKGDWEVDFLRLSKDNSKFYITTTQVHPGERHLYSIPIGGGDKIRLTEREGWHEAYFSPDEKQIALKYGDSIHPSELYVMANRPKAEMIKLTDSITDEYKSIDWPKPEIISFPDEDNNLIYGDLYLPKNVEGEKPAIIYAHGAGYVQGIYKRWVYTRLLHSYLVQEGYVVLCIDYRGSAGYGRDCRTSVYRNMGDKDIASALAAVDYLVEKHNVDRKRIGIFGESYGGFYTLMSLFKHPGIFAAGIAQVPVTDWAHYNHGYSSRILNLPYEDEEAYLKSSPIYFADGLQDALLIVDGMEDSNVLVQDTMRLVQRLIELRKDNWYYHIYPTEGHGLRQESGRLDFYKRLTEFFNRYLKQ
jgi:dipeptidyl aminopeptidase/acylaminoacyl peptidase